MLHFGIDSFDDLFTTILKNESASPKEYLLTITDLFIPIINNEVSSERFVETGVLDNWLEYALTHAT